MLSDVGVFNAMNEKPAIMQAKIAIALFFIIPNPRLSPSPPRAYARPYALSMEGAGTSSSTRSKISFAEIDSIRA